MKSKSCYPVVLFVLYFQVVKAFNHLAGKNHIKNLELASLAEEDNSMKRGTNHSKRRQFLFSPVLLPSILVSVTSTGFVNSASARDELFRPNPLTNSILEQFRIWDQAEADQMKYGGELAPGSSVGRETYVKLLIPILRINQDIISIYNLVREPGVGLEKINEILNKPEFQKIGFKKIFNVFADNIYYSDPDRANVYLAGGALPKNEQSLAYLLRNDILTNIEALQAEVVFLLKEKKFGNSIIVDDLYQYSEDAKLGMSKYLELIPPVERETAESLLN